MRRSYPRGRAAAKPDAAEFKASLEEVCRARISELLQAILEAEVDEALERLRYERRGGSKKPGYRDGHDRQRTITSNRGPIDVKRPRVRGTSFSSAVLPKHKRRLRDVDASLTELWLDGLATRDFEGTLRAFLGADAPLSAATITRVNKQLAEEFAAWSTRRLDDVDLVFSWADGVYLGAGPDDERRVFLAVMGADREGYKHLVALQEAGAAQQRCWLHRIRNVEEKLPKEHRGAVHAALGEAMHAETAQLARAKLDKLAKSYERRYPKAAACIRDDYERLVAYYRFPPATWVHLRTTNVIESIFAPIRHRTDAMKRLRTAEFANAVTYALIQNLSQTWRRLHGYRDLIDLAPNALATRRAA